MWVNVVAELDVGISGDAVHRLCFLPLAHATH